MRSKIFSLFSVAAVALLLLHSPNAAAQFTIFSGGEEVYRQAVETPDSVVLSFTVATVKESQVRDASTVGGTIAKASDAVDLGLPSGTLWSPWNVGAKSAGEAGAHFAWGEVQAKDYYDWDSYYWMADGKSSWEHITKYQSEDRKASADWYAGYNFIGDGKTTLDESDDAASVNWGGKWRMPTTSEIQELRNECEWIWKEENEYATGSLAGYLVTGPNGNTIFLPAAGYRSDSDLEYSGSYGYYWSSELESDRSRFANSLRIYPSNSDAWDSQSRDYGQSVRAVRSATE